MTRLQSALSLRSKIILLISGTAFFSSVLIGGLNFYQIRQVATEQAVENLAGENPPCRPRSAIDLRVFEK
jgi:hypothetical protein